VCHTVEPCIRVVFVLFIYLFCLHFTTLRAMRASCSVTLNTTVFYPPSASSQSDEERQQALQAFSAQAFLGSPQQNTGSSSSSGTSVTGLLSSEHKPKVKRGPRKNQNEKYRLKYLRLRKTARAMIFVSSTCIHEEKSHCFTSVHME